MLGFKEYIVLAVILISNFLQAITGFAGSFLTMPPAIQLLGAGEARILVAFVAQISSIMILMTGLRHVQWRQCGKILFWAGIGMVAGILIFAKVNLQILLVLYGVLIIAIALKNLITSFRPDDAKASVLAQFDAAKAPTQPDAATRRSRFDIDAKHPLMIAIIIAGGILNGVFLSGGAFLVIYATKAIPKKEEMRVTLAVIWIVLNSFVTIPGAFAGAFTKDILLMSAISAVLLVIGTWAGTKVMKRISQETFMKITYVLLLIAGIVVFL